MRIKFVEIENFRRLKSTRIHFGNKNTILTGPNNSGKTTAMNALIKFLKEKEKIFINDFTLSVHKEINKIGEQWEEKYLDKEVEIDDLKIDEDEIDDTLKLIDKLVPKLDIWLKVEEGEEMHVEELLPTLNWTIEDDLGIRIMLDIGDNLQNLHRDYIQNKINCNEAKKIEPEVKLWPLNLVDFLCGNKEPNLAKYFNKKVYILNPKKLYTDDKILENDNLTKLQPLSRNLAPLSMEILKGLFRVDVIKAQRGFQDDEGDPLSKQLHRYYINHLDMETRPNGDDLKIRKIQQGTDLKINNGLKLSFKPAISELNNLGYPGFSDPQLKITTVTDMSEQIERSTKMTNKVHGDYDIPESYNGLGYQNLISMTFLMIEFRDGWMCKGKGYENRIDHSIPKLHLVLIEEPEAHLHVQVQEVFLKNAYKTLTKNIPKQYHTQLVISTHSSNIVNRAEFKNVRYFKKQKIDDEECPVSSVINMHNIFGRENSSESITKRFVKRYIRSSHCDLFFADAIILVEGKAEAILLPHFITNHFDKLDNTYISILEIGGRHMHTLRPLIETLDVPCLIITDTDAGEIEGNHSKMQPTRDDNCTTTNTTIRLWLRSLGEEKGKDGKAKYEILNDIIDLTDLEKHPKHSITEELCRDIRFAYQTEVCIKIDNGDIDYIPNTFEDALISKNIEFFSNENKYDIFTDNNTTKILKCLNNTKNEEEFRKELYNAPKELDKANFALDLFYLEKLNKIKPPDYIADGLRWLIKRLEERENESAPCMEVECYG